MVFLLLRAHPVAALIVAMALLPFAKGGGDNEGYQYTYYHDDWWHRDDDWNHHDDDWYYHTSTYWPTDHHDDHDNYYYKPCGHTIADIACGGTYDILCEAVETAGLYHTLDDKHELFTAFFPTDQAFEELLDQLGLNDIDDVPVHTLEEILLLHLKKGHAYYKDDLKHRCTHLMTMTSHDQTRTICKDDKQRIYQKGYGNVDEDRPKIINFDQEACNGVVHAVDEVILPRHLGPTRPDECDTITEIACDDGGFEILCDALLYTGLDVPLDDGDSTWTVFAPTDAAFHEMLNRLDLDSVRDLDDEAVKDLLLYHAVADTELDFDDLDCGGELAMASGETSKTTCNDNGERRYQRGTCNRQENSNVPGIIESDVEACNGLLQIVEDVLLPGAFCPPTFRPTPRPQRPPTPRPVAPTPRPVNPTPRPQRPPTPRPVQPTKQPTKRPTRRPTKRPTKHPTRRPTRRPTKRPTKHPTRHPTRRPTYKPRYKPTYKPGWRIADAASASTSNCDSEGASDSIEALVCSENRFSILCGALDATGLSDRLANDGSFTLFAPTNEAFEVLGVGTLENLQADPLGDLSRVILYHVIDDEYTNEELLCNQEILSLASGNFGSDFSTTICNGDGKSQVGRGNLFGVWPLITESDISTCNGVVHVVSNVLVPNPN